MKGSEWSADCRVVGVRLAGSAQRAAQRMARLEAIRSVTGVEPFTAEMATHHADIFAELYRKGRLIPQNDLTVAAVALWHWRLPFLVMPVAVTLWYMGMDIVPMLVLQAQGAVPTPGLDGPMAGEMVGAMWDAQWALRRIVTLVFGLGMVALALWVDLRSPREQDFGFWLHLFGVVSGWAALTAMDATSQWGRLGYCAINVALILFGVVIGRRVYAVFGGIGVAMYLGYLAFTLFPDSMMLPFVLSLIGLGAIGLGLLWQGHESALTELLRARLPRAWRALPSAVATKRPSCLSAARPMPAAAP
jgi:hypothetical protein